ncbi:hypothetical protein [Streptomyces sp. AC550_RSS872]|uniref:hypothetical protein n=1 Tax=Streptomyces sp. AC550_RSS872 TaxID=2823689 RepID=UPI001C261E09|nr:hypothetical protein [Streptomyces sp. AC550_RSS872]
MTEHGTGAREPAFADLMSELASFRNGQLLRRPSDRILARAAGVSPTTIGDWLRADRFPQQVGPLLAVLRALRGQANLAGLADDQAAAALLDPKRWRRAYQAEADRRASATRVAVQAQQGQTVLERMRPGWPLSEVTDPLQFEVHRAIDSPIAGLPVLPPYVRRAHDRELGEVVARAAAGTSQIAVLVGGSSTGKTRACWEALNLLRERDDPWRLWHPIDPTRPEAALAELKDIAPYTVVWLNEAQFYLADGTVGERVAAGLRSLLREPGRGPVLVLGTVWPGHWSTMTTPPADAAVDPHAQARALLTGHDVPVPETFTDTERQLLARASKDDPRLQQAAARAEQGQITQYLAGAPALLDRYRSAPAPARALITAAMDARRLGHGPALPRAVLEAAAEGYLTDAQYDLLEDDWLDRALAYTATPVHGTRGPLSRIRPRPGHPHPAQPSYRLADYLEQHAHTTRHATPAPAALWHALIDHAPPTDRITLQRAAVERGLLRTAAGFDAVTVSAPDIQSAQLTGEELVWIEQDATRIPTPAQLMDDLLPALKKLGRMEQAIRKYQALTDTDDNFDWPWMAARLLEEVGRVEEAMSWYFRAAEAGSPRALSAAVWMLRKAGRPQEGVRLYRFGWQPDGSIAVPWSALPKR